MSIDSVWKKGLFVTIAALLPLAQVVPAHAACQADSGTTRASLVELYTSEGCSSCPPADKELGKLTHAGSRIVPLALHVDYWDYIGWKDPFAQAAFARRQDWEVHANQSRTSYTPHFFVNGKEVLDWRADLDVNLRASPVAPWHASPCRPSRRARTVCASRSTAMSSATANRMAPCRCSSS